MRYKTGRAVGSRKANAKVIQHNNIKGSERMLSSDKVALIVASLALVGSIAGSIVSYVGVKETITSSQIATKDTIKSQFEIQRLNSESDINKTKLEKTIQIKNEAYSEFLANMTLMQDFVYFANIPTNISTDNHNNINLLLIQARQDYDNKLIFSFYKIYTLLDDNKKQEAEKLFKKLRTQYAFIFLKNFSSSQNLLEQNYTRTLPQLMITEEKLKLILK